MTPEERYEYDSSGYLLLEDAIEPEGFSPPPPNHGKNNTSRSKRHNIRHTVHTGRPSRSDRRVA